MLLVSNGNGMMSRRGTFTKSFDVIDCLCVNQNPRYKCGAAISAITAVLKFHETGHCLKTFVRVNILKSEVDGSFIKDYKDKSFPVYAEYAWQKHKVQER